jgi:hypothetical protein
MFVNWNIENSPYWTTWKKLKFRTNGAIQYKLD